MRELSEYELCHALAPQDYNDPFDFLADESMDGHYCAQACVYVANKVGYS